MIELLEVKEFLSCNLLEGMVFFMNGWYYLGIRFVRVVFEEVVFKYFVWFLNFGVFEDCCWGGVKFWEGIGWRIGIVEYEMGIGI